MACDQEKRLREEYRIMLEKPVRPLLLKLAVPAVIGMLITSFYSLADSFFVARIGEDKTQIVTASAAVGVVFSVMALIQALGYTFGTGAGSLVSRALGEKKSDRADRLAFSGFCFSLAAGGLVTLFGLLFQVPLLRFLGASEIVLPEALRYARFIWIGAPVMIGSLVLNHLLRAEGKTILAMVGVVLGGVLNIGLDPLLIFVFSLGIRGASLATLISQSVSFLFMLGCFFSKKTALSFRLTRLSFTPRSCVNILSAGLPSLWRQGLAASAAIALNHAASRIDDTAVSAMSISGKLFMLLFAVVLGLGQAYQPFVGYNYGAGRVDRIRRAFFFLVFCSTGLMLLLGGVMFFLAPQAVSFMVRGHTDVAALGVEALRFQCAVVALIPLSVVCNMTFQATGKKGLASFLASCRQGLFFLPLIQILPRLFGMTGLVLAQPIADALTFLISFPFAVAIVKKWRSRNGNAITR